MVLEAKAASGVHTNTESALFFETQETCVSVLCNKKLQEDVSFL